MFSKIHLAKAAKIAGARKSMDASSGNPPETTPTAKATAVVDVIVSLMRLFGFKDALYQGSRAHKADVEHWALLFGECDWIKATKYKIAAYYQVHNLHLLKDLTLPPKPFGQPDAPSVLLHGTAGRFMSNRVGRHLSKHPREGDRIEREEFLSSILQLKKGMPRPGKAFLAEARAKTLKALTNRKVRVGSSFLSNGIHVKNNRISFNDITEQVKRTTQELFQGKKFTSADLLSSPTMPSLSANYSANRTKLGTFGWLRSQGLLGDEQEKNPLLSATRKYAPPMVGPVVDSWSYNLKGEMDFKARFSRPVVQEEGREDIASEVPTFTVKGINGMRDQYVKTYFDTLKIAVNEQPYAKAVALAEALKARVITAGPPGIQFCLKPVQRFMWKILAKHPVFELTGTPQTAAIVERAMGQLRAGEAWLSGDYADATNQLDPKLSGAVWDTMADACALPLALRQLGHRALTGHIIQMDAFGDDFELQQWGQLMGSIISFPVLCVINAAICRMALEHSRGVAGIALKDLPLLVNGDDCVFPVNAAGYSFWNAVGAMAGLAPSIGKVYYSEKFLNINSTNYQYWPRQPGDILADEMKSWKWFTETRAINLGLILGLKRSESTVETSAAERLVDDGMSSLGARHQTLMEKSPADCLHRVHNRFIWQNRELLKSAQVPWYVPKCYGGLGLKPMKEFGAVPSVIDRQIVTAMVNEGLWNQKGETVPIARSLKPKAVTQIHDVAAQKLREALPPLERRWVLPESDEQDGFDCPEIDLFVVYLYPELVEAIEDGEMADNVLNHNRRLWDWFQKRMGLFGWMTPLEECKPLRVVHNVRLISENGRPFTGSDFDLNEHWGDREMGDPWE